MEYHFLPGKPYPLGATWDGTGVNFALHSEHAIGVDLCLYDSRTRKETARYGLTEQTAFVWHTYVHGLQPGQLYGYRVHGPWDPGNGMCLCGAHHTLKTARERARRMGLSAQG